MIVILRTKKEFRFAPANNTPRTFEQQSDAYPKHQKQLWDSKRNQRLKLATITLVIIFILVANQQLHDLF